MVGEAVQNYVNLVSGLTRTTRARAVAGARAVLAQAGLEDVATDAGGRVSKLADEIVAASKANRELMRNLIASEVEQVVSHLGFARAEELERLRREVGDLQQAVRDLGGPVPTASSRARSKSAPTRPTSATFVSGPGDSGPTDD